MILESLRKDNLPRARIAYIFQSSHHQEDPPVLFSGKKRAMCILARLLLLK